MYIYNLTFTIETAIREEWLQWMQYEYIPAMLATEKFFKAQVNKVLLRGKEELTYAVQFQCADKASFKQYYIEDHANMAKKLEQFKGSMVYFGTEMEVINQQG